MESRMNVLMLNGSPRTNGNIALAFQEMEQVFRENGIGVENIQLGKQVIRGCIACESCRKTHKCVFDDIVNKLAEKFEAADGLVIGSPVYFGSAIRQRHPDVRAAAAVLQHLLRQKPEGRRQRGQRPAFRLHRHL